MNKIEFVEELLKKYEVTLLPSNCIGVINKKRK